MRSSLLPFLLTLALLPAAPLAQAQPPGSQPAEPQPPGSQHSPFQLPPPRPLEPWERVAVGLAVAYLEQGPAAWWPRLAPGSPLAVRGEAAARVELEACLGPAAGARWELLTVVGPAPGAGRGADGGVEGGAAGTAAFRLELPSGLDRVVFLDLVPAGDGWALRSLRSWAEPSPLPASTVRAAGARELERGAADPEAPPAPAAGGAPGGGDPFLPALPGGLLSAALLGAALLAWRARRRVVSGALVLLAAGVVLLVAGAVPAWKRGPVGEGAPAPLVARSPTVPAGPTPSVPPGERPAAERLRRAQYLLQTGDLNGTQALLQSLPSPSPYPLAHVLAGRLAFLRGEEVATALAYEEALEELPAVDSLLLEAAEALLAMGFDEHAREILERLARGGSRNAEAHYLLARFAAVDGRTKEAARHFRRAWELAPRQRSELLEEPLYAYLVRQGGLFGLLRLDEAEEPVVVAAAAGRHALTLPPGFAATTSGQRLRLAGGGGEVLVPGGAELAPREAVAESAAARRRREEARVLAALPELVQASASPGGLSQPALRRRLTTAALALGRRHRWAEVLELTRGLAARPERLPDELARLRAEALRRAGRTGEAARLLVQLAKSNGAHRRKDPDALFHLADLLVQVGEYDYAEGIARLAEGQSPTPPVTSLLPRIRMERRLALSYGVHTSPHFEVRYPAAADPLQVASLARVLEKERERLERWIPGGSTGPIQVHLYAASDFDRLYSMGGVAGGLFDGKVRVPLDAAPRLGPAYVALLSHEIAHALITAATEDRAPAWLHEGLAQHVQMVAARPNTIPDYAHAGKLLAFPVLEPILAGHSDPELVALAYEEAVWVLHYVESRYGVDGIHRLLAAFARGLSTEEAVAELTGQSLPAFDAAFRRWCLAEAPAAWETEVIRYDREP